MTVIETTPVVEIPESNKVEGSTSLGPLESVFDALVKAVAKEVMANMNDQLLNSDEFDIKLRELINEESGDIVDNWISNNFDIYDYEDSIQQMIEVDDDQIIRVVKDLSFTVSVD